MPPLFDGWLFGLSRGPGSRFQTWVRRLVDTSPLPWWLIAAAWSIGAVSWFLSGPWWTAIPLVVLSISALVIFEIRVASAKREYNEFLAGCQVRKVDQ